MRKALVATVAIATLGWGCGGDETPRPTASSTPCPTPDVAANAGQVPRNLRLAEHATVIEVVRRNQALGITAVSDKTVVELYPPLARAILDAGYSIVSSDNEGFEAEIFFGDRNVTAAYRLREGPCRDQVTVRLLFEDRRR